MNRPTTHISTITTVKITSEVNTVPRLTAGDTALLVNIALNTIQGWRPISVNIHPRELPSNGNSGRASPAASNQREAGARPRRMAHSIQTATMPARAPKPIISRKLQ